MADERDLALIDEIEADASAAFDATRFANAIEDMPFASAFWQGHVGSDRWEIAVLDGEPVGILIHGTRNRTRHLFEMSVRRARQGQGTGTAMLERVKSCAREAHQPVVLTTFRDLPFNEAFYSRNGFRELTDLSAYPVLSKELAAVEERTGLGTRIAMIWEGGER